MKKVLYEMEIPTEKKEKKLDKPDKYGVRHIYYATIYETVQVYEKDGKFYRSDNPDKPVSPKKVAYWRSMALINSGRATEIAAGPRRR